MNKRKIVVIAVAILVAVGVAVGAGFGINAYVRRTKAEYEARIFHAKILSGMSYKDEFKKNNKTKNALYKNEEYDPSDPYSEEYYIDSTSPSTRTYIIRTQEELEEVFDQCPSVDFEKEMVVVHVYTSCSTTTGKKVTIKISDVELNDKTLKMEIEKNYEHAIYPLYQSFLTVKLDKIDIDEVEVKVK